jgi:hypothetical protein
MYHKIGKILSDVGPTLCTINTINQFMYKMYGLFKFRITDKLKTNTRGRRIQIN